MSTVAVDVTKKVAKILEANLQTYIEFQSAYDQCDSEIQEVVKDMLNIIRSEDASDDEKKRASATVMEALFPSLAADYCEVELAAANHPNSMEREMQLDEQEKTFSARVRAQMEAKGITQEQLADLVGVSQPAISLILNREARPQQRTVKKFAEALGVSEEELWPVQ